MIYLSTLQTNIAQDILDICTVITKLDDITETDTEQNVLKLKEDMTVFVYQNSEQERLLRECQERYDQNAADLSELHKAKKVFDTYLEFLSNSGVKCLYVVDDINECTDKVTSYLSSLFVSRGFKLIENVDDAFLSEADVFEYVIANEHTELEISTVTTLSTLETALTVLCDKTTMVALQDCFTHLSGVLTLKDNTINTLGTSLLQTKNLIEQTMENNEELIQNITNLRNQIETAEQKKPKFSRLAYTSPSKVGLEMQDHVLYIKCYSEVLGLTTFINSYAKFLTMMHNIPCKVLYLFSSVSPLMEKFQAHADFVKISSSLLQNIKQNTDKVVFYTDSLITNTFQAFFSQKEFKNVIVVDMTYLTKGLLPSSLLESVSKKLVNMNAYSSFTGAFSMALNYDTKKFPTYEPFLKEIKKGLELLQLSQNYAQNREIAKSKKTLADGKNIFKSFIFELPTFLPTALDVRSNQRYDDLYTSYETFYNQAIPQQPKLKNIKEMPAKQSLPNVYTTIMTTLERQGLTPFFIPNLSPHLLLSGQDYSTNFLMTTAEGVSKRDNFFITKFKELKMFERLAQQMGIKLPDC